MDDCSGLDWNPVDVGQPHSQLAAVVAGFLFAGIVFLLGRRKPRENDSYPYVLMLPSLFVLLLDSFFFSVISGEQICNRAWTETMIAAGLLGTGSLGVFGGLSWVIHNARRGEREPLRIVLITSHVIAVVVLLHLQVTTSYYLRDIYSPDDPPSWLLATTWLTTAVVVLSLIVASILRQKLISKRLPVHIAAYCAMSYGIICSIAFSVLGGRPGEQWEPTPDWITATAVLLALTTAGVAVTTLIVALPAARDKPPDPAEPGTPPSSEQSRPDDPSTRADHRPLGDASGKA